MELKKTPSFLEAEGSIIRTTLPSWRRRRSAAIRRAKETRILALEEKRRGKKKGAKGIKGPY